MKIKPIVWTEVREPNDDCSYHHTIGETSFGRFLLTWKGWKEHIDASFDETPWGEFAMPPCDSVEDCQVWAQREFERRIEESLEELQEPHNMFAVTGIDRRNIVGYTDRVEFTFIRDNIEVFSATAWLTTQEIKFNGKFTGEQYYTAEQYILRYMSQSHGWSFVDRNLSTNS